MTKDEMMKFGYSSEFADLYGFTKTKIDHDSITVFYIQNFGLNEEHQKFQIDIFSDLELEYLYKYSTSFEEHKKWVEKAKMKSDSLMFNFESKAPHQMSYLKKVAKCLYGELYFMKFSMDFENLSLNINSSEVISHSNNSYFEFNNYFDIVKKNPSCLNKEKLVCSSIFKKRFQTCLVVSKG